MAKKEFTHVGVEKKTQRAIALLARALDTDMYSLVDYWASREWESAKRAGLVTDAMLTGGEAKGKRATRAAGLKARAA